jgi:type IV secretion system protein TrbG
MRFKRPQVRYANTPQPATPYQSAAQAWDERIGSARVQAKNWRFMAFGCLTLAVLMAGGLVWRSAQSIVTPYVIEVDNSGQVRAVGEAATPYRPSDAQIAYHLGRFIGLVRSLSIDPIVVRQNWLDAYDYTTDKGAVVLNEYARVNDPFARIGKESVTVQISSVTRASDTSFNVRWTETRFVNGALDRTERWNAVVSIVQQTPRHRAARAQKPPGHLRQRAVVEPRTGSERRSKTMNDLFRKSALPIMLLALTGCATQGKPPPSISLDEPVQAQPLPEPPTPVEVVAVPQVLPMPAQMKPVPDAKSVAEPADETVRVSRANAEARIAPTREGYVNAIQVWPFTDGALYQVYAAVGRVTVIALQPGEELVTVAAGDTVRWIVGDTSSGSGDALRVNVMVKPIRSGLKTNLVITTSRRTYLLELTSTEKTWMASLSWEYPKDKMLALQRQAQAASAVAPVDSGLSLEKIRFRYAVSGSNPPWKPLRAFDDGGKVYIQFPPGIAQGELPPLFVIGAQGDGQLVNYRFRSPYYIVDRLFGAAELRLGGDKGDVVRIERTDGVSGGTRRN